MPAKVPKKSRASSVGKSCRKGARKSAREGADQISLWSVRVSARKGACGTTTPRCLQKSPQSPGQVVRTRVLAKAPAKVPANVTGFVHVRPRCGSHFMRPSWRRMLGIGKTCIFTGSMHVFCSAWSIILPCTFTSLIHIVFGTWGRLYDACEAPEKGPGKGNTRSM